MSFKTDTQEGAMCTRANSHAQFVAVCCSVLQCVAGGCSVLQCVAVTHKKEPCALEQTVTHSLLQCVAVCCSVLQCVAVSQGVILK